MAFLMLTAVFVIVFNLVADLAYGWLDPASGMTERLPRSDLWLRSGAGAGMTSRSVGLTPAKGAPSGGLRFRTGSRSATWT